MTRPVLATEGIKHVTGSALDKLQLQHLVQGSGAVDKWPILGVMIKDPATDKKAEEVVQDWLASFGGE